MQQIHFYYKFKIICLFVYLILTNQRDRGTSRICALVSLCARATVRNLSVTQPFS